MSSFAAAGPDPPARPDWTEKDLELWLKAAFAAMPYTAIYAPRGNSLQAVDPNAPDATFDIVAFTGTVLGDRSELRRVLLLWARAAATRGSVGGSVSEFCNERGWKRATFERQRRRALRLVVEAKNKRDGGVRDAA